MLKDTTGRQMSNVYGNITKAAETTQIANDEIYTDVELPALPVEMNEGNETSDNHEDPPSTWAAILTSSSRAPPQPPGWPQLPKDSKRRWLVIALVALLAVMFLLWVIQISVMMSYFSQVLQHTKKGQESVIAEIHEFYSKVVLHLTESQKNLTVEIQQLKTEMFKPSCPSTWKQIQSKCYYISTTSLTWEEAKEDCIARQGQLLVLRDQTESNALRVYLSPQPFWISLKRKINTWIWLDGTIPSFTSWAPYEPNNARGIEDCVELKEGLWNDVACTKKNPYVCKSIWFY